MTIPNVNRASSRDQPVDAVVGGIRVRVVEDIERTFVAAHIYAERLAGSRVDDGDPEPPVDLAPKQPDLEAAVTRLLSSRIEVRDSAIIWHACLVGVCSFAAPSLAAIARTYASLTEKRGAATRVHRTERSVQRGPGAAARTRRADSRARVAGLRSTAARVGPALESMTPGMLIVSQRALSTAFATKRGSTAKRPLALLLANCATGLVAGRKRSKRPVRGPCFSAEGGAGALAAFGLTPTAPWTRTSCG